VQHDNFFADRGEIDDPKGACRFSYPDLTNPRTHRLHGFPAHRLEALLNLTELIACL
jgi:hypothetical protein